MKIYFKNDTSGDVFVLLKSDTNGISTCSLAEKISDNEYSALIDSDLYTHIGFKTNGTTTEFIPLTSLADGFYINKSGQLDFYVHSAVKYGSIEYFKLPYRDSTKRIAIWLPENYSDCKKYKVIYMTDAQNLFDRRQSYYGEIWSADVITYSAIKKYNKDIMIVGIYNDEGENRRFEDLTPPIGEVTNMPMDEGYSPHGGELLAFIKDMLIPFVNENYSVSHSENAIIGSSCGGLAAFYLGLELMDVFSFIGSFSPAFLLFDEEAWKKYLSKFNFKSNKKLPYLFLYTGNNDDLEKDICRYTLEMYKKLHYPKELTTLIVNDKALHNEVYWRYHLPQALEKWLNQN